MDLTALVQNFDYKASMMSVFHIGIFDVFITRKT